MSDTEDLRRFQEKVGTTPQRNHHDGPRGAVEAAGINEPATGAPAPTLGAVMVRRWSLSGDFYWPASETVEALDAGFYAFNAMPNIGPCLVKQRISLDNLIRLPDSAGEAVLREFETFWTLKPRFTQLGFLHKRGILLWGPPGSGKTCTLMMMAKDIVDQGGIVCQIGVPSLAATCLSFIRKIEPDRPIVAVMEDIDALVAQEGEQQFLALLDGETQVDNICYIATTNYPERLDKRFADRPSRFDTIRYVGMPSAAARRTYLSAKMPDLSDRDMAEWVSCTEGLSVAHLREMIILVLAFGRPLSDAAARMEAMRIVPNSEHGPDKMPVGIVAPRSNGSARIGESLGRN